MESDTSREAAAIRLAALRRLDGASRLAQALEMSEAVQGIAEAGRVARAEEGPLASLPDKRDEPS